MPDVTVTLSEDELRYLERMIGLRVRGFMSPEDSAIKRRLNAAQPAAPGPLERLEAWIWMRPLNRWAELRLDYGLNQLVCSLGIVEAKAPTLAAAIEAALKQVEKQP